MKKKLIVAPGGSVFHKGRIYKPGSTLPASSLGPHKIRELCSSGYAKVYEEAPEIDPDELIEDLPGRAENPEVSHRDDSSTVIGGGRSPDQVRKEIDEAHREALRRTEDLPAKVPGPGKGKIKHRSPWALDPDALRSHDLEALNVMVAERDDSLEPFDTVEEAVGWLSQDYEPVEESTSSERSGALKG